MQSASRIFRWAGIYGVIVIAPMFFLEARYGRDHPPAIAHPELYYGFVGVTLAWQALFLLIATDPARYRPAMLVAVLEKLPYGGTTSILWLLGRASPSVASFGAVDLALAALFVYAYRRTTPSVAGAEHQPSRAVAGR